MNKRIIGIFIMTLLLTIGFGSISGTTNIVNEKSYTVQNTAREFLIADVVIMYNGNYDESYVRIYPGDDIPDPLDLNTPSENIIFKINVQMDLWGALDEGTVSAVIKKNGETQKSWTKTTGGSWSGTWSDTINCVDGTLIQWEITVRGHDFWFPADKFDDVSGSTTCRWIEIVESHADIRGSISGSIHFLDVIYPEYQEDEFEIRNDGHENSELYWEVYSYPSWGSGWSANPHQGTLSPSDGWQTVTVGFITPIGLPGDKFSSQLVVSTNAPNQYTIDVPASFSVPMNNEVYFNLFFQYLIEHFSHLFPF